MQISANIKHLRKQNRWSQRELAQRSGLAQLQIWQYENNIVEPTISNLTKIANAFGLTFAELVSLPAPDKVAT